MGNGKEREFIFCLRRGDLGSLPPQRPSFFGYCLSGQNRIEHERGLHATEIGTTQRIEAWQWPGVAIETDENCLPLVVCEGNTGYLLGRLQHLECNARRVLCHSHQSTGHQRKAAGREAFQKPSSIEAES